MLTTHRLFDAALLVQIGDPPAVGREAGIDIQALALRQPALVGAVGVHEVELVAAAVGRMAVGDRHEPMAVGRPVVDFVGLGDRQLGGA